MRSFIKKILRALVIKHPPLALGAIFLMVTLCVVSQSVRRIGDDDITGFRTLLTDSSYATTQTTPNTNHIQQERDMSLEQALLLYQKALRDDDKVGLFRSYRTLCQISLRRMEFDKVFEYGKKAIELYPSIPQTYNVAQIYLYMYQAGPDRYPYDDIHGLLLDKMIQESKTTLSLFTSYLMKAIFYGRRNNVEKYEEYRQKYKQLETPAYIQRGNSGYNRAESYHYYFTGQKDSVFIIRNRIQLNSERYHALMIMYRNYGMYKEAMNYADSTDKALRQYNASINSLTTAELQNSIEKVQLRIQEENDKERITLEESRQRQQMLENQRQELANEKAAGEAQRLQLEKKSRDRELALEELKIGQREAEAHRIETERRENAEIQVKMDKANEMHIAYLIVGGMFVVLLLLAFWVYSVIKANKRIRQLTKAQQKAHDEAVFAAESKNNFIANMSHDMKDPLQLVAKYAKILADDSNGLTDEERMDIGIKAQEVGTKLLDYINKILDPTSVSSHPDHSTDADRITHIKSMQGLTVLAFLVFSLSFLTLSVNGYSSVAPITETVTYNNPFKIDDVVYAEYNKANNLRADIKAMLPVWNKAWSLAVSRDEKKGQCMLYYILMKSYEYSGVHKEVEATAAKLQELSRRYGYMQYYYSSMANLVDYYLVYNDVVKAIHIASTMRQEAETSNNPFGLYYTCQAYIYISKERDDSKDVVEWARKAIDISHRLPTPQDLCPLYLAIYDYTPGAKRSDEGRKLLQLAFSSAKTSYNKALCYRAFAENFFYKGDTIQFNKYVDLLNKTGVRNQIKDNPETMILEAMEKTIKGNNEAALKIFDGRKGLPALKAALQVAKFTGHYKEALEIRDKVLEARQIALERKYKNDILSLAKYESDDSLIRTVNQHKIEIERLAERNKELQLNRQRLAFEQEKKEDELQNLEMANTASKDSLQMRSAELARRQAETKTEQARLRTEESELEQQEIDNYYLLGKVAAAAIIVLVLVLVLVLVFNHRSTKRLNEHNAKLHEACEEAIHAKEMKEVFIQNMSHEIRTPLNAILGFSQLLSLPADSFEKDERKHFAEHVDHNVRLLSMLIEDIVNIGDIEKGIYSIHIAPTEINKVIRTAISTVEYRVTADIQLIMESQLPDSFIIDTDGQRVMQVLINYLTNAIKHTAGGTIKVDASITPSSMLRLAVSDTGTGVPADQAENIFRRFVKLEEFVQGTGLGLNICRIISQKLGGRVYLDTSYPKAYEGVEHGARFVLELPCKES